MMPPKQLLLLATLVLSSAAGAQSRLKADNRQLDSLTQGMDTYTITLVVNDVPSENAAREAITVALRSDYTFLKEKKQRKEGGDFTLRIDLRGSHLGAVTYSDTTISGVDGTLRFRRHDLDHQVSGTLTFLNGTGVLMSVPLDSGVIVHRRYTERLDDPTRNSEWARRDLHKFENDFFDLLDLYAGRPPRSAAPKEFYQVRKVQTIKAVPSTRTGARVQ